MICAMCLTAETPNSSVEICTECMKSLKYAENLIKTKGVGLKVTYNKGMEAGVVKGDLAPVHEKAHWVVEMTAIQDRHGTIDQPIFEGTANGLEEACKIALAKLEEDLK